MHALWYSKLPRTPCWIRRHDTNTTRRVFWPSLTMLFQASRHEQRLCLQIICICELCLGTRFVIVSHYSFLPGAIALLLESVDAELACEWGEPWLKMNRGHRCARDVALCVASAKCDLAARQVLA